MRTTGSRCPTSPTDNELHVVADCPYTRTGEGLHRFVDPADDRVYLYTQFEMADARRMFASFEQPDLKACSRSPSPHRDWTVVSNAPTPAPEPSATATARGASPRPSAMSTYLTALVAGPYHAVHDSYPAARAGIQLGVFCRPVAGRAPRRRRDLRDHQAGLRLLRGRRSPCPYPFGKYDQVFVPEFNAGAMENVGCGDVPRRLHLPQPVTDGARTRTRANTILHEMAHMWFGDLVTMRWWDDLWLNESFAEWASHARAGRGDPVHRRLDDVLQLDARPGRTGRTSSPPPTRSPPTSSTSRRSSSTSTASRTPRAPRCSSSWSPTSGGTRSSPGCARYFSAHAWGNTDAGRPAGRAGGRRPGGTCGCGRRSGWRPRRSTRCARSSTSAPTARSPRSPSCRTRPAGLSDAADPPASPSACTTCRATRLVRAERVELDVDGAAHRVPALVGRTQPPTWCWSTTTT